MRTHNVPEILFDPDLPPGALSFDHVLFLDFDGVLHPDASGSDNESEFMFVDGFCDVVRKVDPQGLRPIVVSSMWRETHSIAQLRSHFPVDIARQIVGVTPNFEPVSAPGAPQLGWGDGSLTCSMGNRQRECEHWMSLYAPAGKWLAIDDRENYFEEGCPHLFLVPPAYEEDGGGLCEAQCRLLQKRLRAWKSQSRLEI